MPNDLNDPATMVDKLGRPLQCVPWKEKDEDWFKRNVEFCIMRTNFNFGAQTNGRKDLRVFYDVYNNQFPLDWFNHITDPLSAKVEAHKAFPAKIRPVTILRQNIDLLLGEWPRRPFVYNVRNLGEDGFNTYVDNMMKEVTGNITKHFIQAVLQQKQQNGEELSPQQQQQLQQNPPLPQEVQAEFQSSYKDALCIKAQKWLDRQIEEKGVKQKLHLMFKDWLLAGQCYSYKGIRNDTLIYDWVSPLNIDFDKSMDKEMVEDGEWVVARYLWTLADTVDNFYQMLTEEDQKKIEFEYWTNSPTGYYENLRGIFVDPQERNKLPVYHVQWKGRKKIGILSYLDLETFQYVEEEIDENYPIDRAKGEHVEWFWVNEVYEGYRIGKDMFVGMQAAPVQRTEMNNHSACKLNYNGRKFSDRHSDNISVIEMGIPFQIMVIIVTYLIEKTIAKSKGKILMIDQNAIPNEGDWDEEKFFYYAEAFGYALVNRNQTGVDKSFNQYQVVDMSLFEQIKQLIELQNYYKQQWDDCIGINRQRKGETYASDGQGVNERATFQSTVMTDMIFLRFEEFVQTELQGFIDFIHILTSKGDRSMWMDDDLGTQLMEIFPEDFSMAQLGVYVSASADIMNKLKQAQAVAQSMAQREGKASTIIEIIDSNNIADLKRKLKQLEAIEQQIATQQQQSEQEHDKDLEEMKQRYDQYDHLLDREFMEAEYDRKEELATNIEYIKGTFMVEALDKGDKGADALGAQKLLAEREKNQQEFAAKKADRALKSQELQDKKTKMEHDIQMAHKDHELKKKKLVIDRIKANKTSKPK